MFESKWIIINFLVTLTTVNFVGCARILVLVPWYEKSHFRLFENLIDELLERGHGVTCISNFLPGQRIQDNRNFSSILIDPPYKSSNDISSSFSYFTSFLNLQQTGVAVSRHGLQSKNVQKFLMENTQQSFDLVILEQFYHESWLMFGTIFDALVITFDVNGYSDIHDRLMGFNAPWSRIPHNMLPFNHQMTFAERFLNVVISWSDYIVRNICYLYQQNQIINEFFPTNIIQKGVKIPSVYDLERNISAILINSHEAFPQLPRPQMPNIVNIGGMHLTSRNNKEQQMFKDLQEFLDTAENGFVYINIEMAKVSSKVFKTFLDNIAKRPQRFVLRHKPRDIMHIPKNIWMENLSSQQKILEHKNIVAFVTDGDILSIQEGLYFGVPMFVLETESLEQQRNARLLVKSRLGLMSTPLKDLTDELLEEYLDDLLFEKEYLENAKKVSKLFKDNLVNPMEKAIYWIEHVIRHNGAYHLKYQEQLNIIQYYSFDVYGLVILLTIVVFFIYSTASKMLKHLVLSKKKKNNNIYERKRV